MSPSVRAAHVAAASLNQTVGDWAGNARRIRAALDEARDRGARLLVLPELCISGYSLGDRLLMPGTLDRSWRVLDQVREHTAGLVAAVGLPVRHHGVLYNAVAVLADRRLAGLVVKENLATGDVQYENRWYSGWVRGRVQEYACPDGSRVPIGSMLFEARGLGRFAIEICEDGWKGLRPGSVYALAGAQIIANPSASWFELGKHRVRRRMVQQISGEDHSVYLYTSLLGCDATRLIFDGSVFIAHGGGVGAEGRRFRFGADHEMVDRVVDLDTLSHARTEEGSWRQQLEALQRGDFGPVPPTIQVEGDFSTGRDPGAPGPYWTAGLDDEPADPSLDWLHSAGLVARPPTPPDLPHLELELALCLGMREYLTKCGIPGVALALSGGRDSTTCALLLHRMLRYDAPEATPAELRELAAERLLTAYMATDHSSGATQAAARAVAETIGSTHHEAVIQSAVDTHLELAHTLTGQRLSWADHDIPLQNVQARLRGSLIWLLANIHGFLLLATSNKSEAAVGYATMDGDTSGGLAPLSDVPKSLVELWLRWARDFHGYTVVDRVLSVPATAELRPGESGQTDEDDLMPFFVLDQLMFQFVQCGRDPVEMFRALWPALHDHYRGDARAFADHIGKFVRLLCRAQWKRERFAIGFRVTAFDLDPKTGFRFPPVQAPFQEELAELDTLIETLTAPTR